MPPALFAILQSHDYQLDMHYNAMDNIVCSTDILCHYGHFAQENIAQDPFARFSKSSLMVQR